MAAYHHEWKVAESFTIWATSWASDRKFRRQDAAESPHVVAGSPFLAVASPAVVPGRGGGLERFALSTVPCRLGHCLGVPSGLVLAGQVRAGLEGFLP